MQRSVLRPSRDHRPSGLGFTLIEAMVATAIVGLGIAAMIASIGSGTRVNDAGTQLTTAAFLAQEVREYTLKLPFSDPDAGSDSNPPGPDGSSPQVFIDDLDDLMGVTYSPPRDCQGFPTDTSPGAPMADMEGWSQAITLSWRDPSDLSTPIDPPAKAAEGEVIYVEADIRLNGATVLTTGWLVMNRAAQ